MARSGILSDEDNILKSEMGSTHLSRRITIFVGAKKQAIPYG